eukprot:CAMPEP_0183711406 /NCGR_PEP_ID=MMETSP0737-20130205/6919_1 /TAXON_ID=385413 /ORGANISM="Thalassiosira miniscula, Strain CCMP1093" /LENGTH=397 /DNA_ID=CAMNT_0025939909 /DNA_START=12 /DNA_END=1205 /DNA_ORIENTATION=-
MTMASPQTRLDKAIIAHEQAEAEVERLCDILERAADALNKARQTKRSAQKELDEAAKAAKASAAAPRGAGSFAAPRHSSGRVDVPAGRDGAARRSNGQGYRQQERVDLPGSRRSNGQGYRREEVQDEPQSDYSDEEGSEYSDETEESGEEDEEEETVDDEEEDDDEAGFDMGNEALEQIRYRLETAKIDPNSPEGTKILDELLIRLQNTKEEVIDSGLINELIDELLFENEEPEGATPEENASRKPPPPQNPQQHPRIRINRGGKVLGWYQGELDERGYARQGKGSMYYDAGHECHGTWEHDEMKGRGIYQWADGHVYDGEWSNGKRHGLGRFIRPDNVVLHGRYVKGHHKGEGVRWSADRREAQVVVDGVPKKTVSLAKAKEIALYLGFDDVLPPV